MRNFAKVETNGSSGGGQASGDRDHVLLSDLALDEPAGEVGVGGEVDREGGIGHVGVEARRRPLPAALQGDAVGTPGRKRPV